MSDEKCPDCGADLFPPPCPEWGVHHQQGGIECLKRQLAQEREKNERLEGVLDQLTAMYGEAPRDTLTRYGTVHERIRTARAAAQPTEPPASQESGREEKGKLSHKDAARLNHYCPLCGLISHDKRPKKRTCTRCGQEAYVACCFDEGRTKLCRHCEEDATEGKQP